MLFVLGALAGVRGLHACISSHARSAPTCRVLEHAQPLISTQFSCLVLPRLVINILAFPVLLQQLLAAGNAGNNLANALSFMNLEAELGLDAWGTPGHLSLQDQLLANTQQANSLLSALDNTARGSGGNTALLLQQLQQLSLQQQLVDQQRQLEQQQREVAAAAAALAAQQQLLMSAKHNLATMTTTDPAQGEQWQLSSATQVQRLFNSIAQQR